MASHASKEESREIWLPAFSDKTANINAYSNCLCTADLDGSGDYKLIIADGSKRLKVYENAYLQGVTRLPGVASGVVTFYSSSPDMMDERPLVAVAVCQHILIYHHNKPYYRLTAPPIRAPEALVRAWQAAAEDEITVDKLIAELRACRADDTTAPLPRVVHELMRGKTTAERQQLLHRTPVSALEEPDVVTCLAVIAVHGVDAARPPSALVYGTEKRKTIAIVTPHDMQPIVTVVLPDTPVFILTWGSLRVEYDVVVSCRDGCVYRIHNGVLSEHVIRPDSQPVAMASYNAWIALATVRRTISYYTRDGRLLAQVRTPLGVTNMVTLTDAMTNAARGLIVALSTGQIEIYVGTQRYHSSSLQGTVIGLIYSRYGREDAALIAVLQRGSLVVRMLHRRVRLPQLDITEAGAAVGSTRRGQTDAGGDASAEKEASDRRALEERVWATDDQEVLHKLSAATPSLPIPTLCSLFETHSDQERKQAMEQYYTFQHNVCALRLHTARSYRDMLFHHRSSASAPSADNTAQAESHHRTESSAMDASGAMLYALHDTHSTLQLTTTVLGSERAFRVRAHIVNDGEKALLGLTLVVSATQRLYDVSRSMHTIAYLGPSMRVMCDVGIHVNADETALEPIWLHVTDEISSSVIASTSVELPLQKLT